VSPTNRHEGMHKNAFIAVISGTALSGPCLEPALIIAHLFEPDERPDYCTTKFETLLVASVNESIAPEVTTGVRSTVEMTAQYCTPVPAC